MSRLHRFERGQPARAVLAVVVTTIIAALGLLVWGQLSPETDTLLVSVLRNVVQVTFILAIWALLGTLAFFLVHGLLRVPRIIAEMICTGVLVASIWFLLDRSFTDSADGTPVPLATDLCEAAVFFLICAPFGLIYWLLAGRPKSWREDPPFDWGKPRQR